MKITKPGISLIKKSLPMFRCPECFSRKLELDDKDGSTVLTCPGCGAQFPVVNGIIDFFPGYKAAKGLSQKAMENRMIVKIYEKYFRPLFVRLGSPINYQEEEEWLHDSCKNKNIETVLDLATGTGRYARLINEKYNPDTVIALDLSIPMLEKGQEIARSKGHDNIIFIKGDACCLPLNDNTIDHINCFGALHLFPEPFTSIREISRAGKSKSFFTCLTACTVSGFLGRSRQRIFSKVATFKFFDINELEAGLEESGFKNFNYIKKKMAIMFSAEL